MIAKKYGDFLRGLNKLNISWCLIKDYDYLMKHGYDNEIDLIAEEKNRNKIRVLARKGGWNESALNSANTHLIFWKFEGLKPFRLDIHMGKALATAVPWFNAEDILKDKMKRGDIWVASPKWELGTLILASFRGRKPKSWRIKKVKELKSCLNDVRFILKPHLNDKEVEKYYNYLIKGKIVRLSVLKRLGVLGIVKQLILFPRLIFCRLVRPAKLIVLSNKNSRQLYSVIAGSKINVKITKNFLSRYVSDVVLKTDRNKKDTDLKILVKNLFGENNVR